MDTFIDENFLLNTEASRRLYHDYAEKMPIIDYHCHIKPEEILEDKTFDNITDLWLKGDHYKLRLMRACGIPESELTGLMEKDPYKVFCGFMETLPKCIGNPVYHWSYLEMKRYFGIEKHLCLKNAREIYDACNERLKDPDMSVRNIIRKSQVKIICTTDDPCDDLSVHKALSQEKDLGFNVYPAFRPDTILFFNRPGFASYIEKLATVSGIQITHFDDLCQALTKRVEYFHQFGCKVSDHALDYAIYEEATPEQLDVIFTKALGGVPCNAVESAQLRTAVLLHLAQLYKKYDWVMQVHFGCLRNNSEKMHDQLGNDCGFDCVGESKDTGKIVALLNAFERADTLPKLVLYSLNHCDNTVIETVAGSFQTNSPSLARVQLGAAWWFNDHKMGMEEQLTDLANLGALGTFIGMLTDSRSFLSYTRHEYFRRILCNLLGSWIENKEVYPDSEGIGTLVEDISYNNAVKYFQFS